MPRFVRGDNVKKIGVNEVKRSSRDIRELMGVKECQPCGLLSESPAFTKRDMRGCVCGDNETTVDSKDCRPQQTGVRVLEEVVANEKKAQN